jgi:GST-like protein
MIDLYYWPTPNGWKISILLEELQVPYRLLPIDITRGEQFSAEFLSVSPNAKIPAMVDHAPAGGSAPVRLFESAAIMMYLAEKHEQLWPRDLHRRYEVVQWLAWQISALGPTAGQVHHFREYASARIDYAIERFSKEINRLYGVLDARLADRDYLAVEYSIADIACWCWARLWRHHDQKLADFPHLERWLMALAERPAVNRGFRVGREFRGERPTMPDEARKILLGQRARGSMPLASEN